MAPCSPNESPIELNIPLPPSPSCSENGEEEQLPNPTVSVPGSPGDFRNEDIPHESPVDPLSATHRYQDPSAQSSLMSTPDGRSTSSLNEVQSLLAFQRFSEKRVRMLQTKLENIRLRCGLDQRLIRVYRRAHRLLAYQFRNKDQSAFVRTYQACQDSASKIGAAGRRLEDGKSPEDDNPPSEESNPIWISLLPRLQQESLLAFFNRMRVDTEFLASCLCKLPSEELVALTSSYKSESPVESVLPSYQSHKATSFPDRLSHGAGQSFSQDIQGLLQDDPLFTILHGLFDESCGTESWDFRQRMEVLSTICARVMEEGKRGSDELTITILETIFGSQSMKPPPKLEEFLLKVLQDGSFILGLPHDTSGKLPLEIRNANVAVESSKYFERCSTDFFALLATNLHLIVPSHAIGFVKAVLGKIGNPSLRTRAKNFIVCKWFFCSFASDLLMYPESRNLLMKHHIGDTARQSLLKTLASRMQNQVWGVVSPWNHHSLIDSTARSMIDKIFSFFEPTQPGGDPSMDRTFPSRTSPMARTGLLTVSPRIIANLIRILLPPAPPSPDSVDPPSSENGSTAPSTAASSTLTSGSMGFDSAVPSSQAPSISGTSMTSTTMLSEQPLAGSEFEDYNVTSDGNASLKAEQPFSDTAIAALLESYVMLESQASSMVASDAWNWTCIYITEDGLSLSLIPPSNQRLNLEQQLSRPSQSNDHLGRSLYNELEPAISDLLADAPLTSHPWHCEEEVKTDGFAALCSLLRCKMAECESHFDYRTAHYWWRSIQTLNQLGRLEGYDTAYSNLLAHLANRKSIEIDRNAELTEVLAKEVHCLEMLAASSKLELQAIEKTQEALRDKVWYMLDIKHSAVYEEALNVTNALKTMADSKRASKRPSSTTIWARQRLHTLYLHDKAPAQALDLLASPKDYGGLSKLSDTQVESTTRWMTKNSIENFCKGEEIIHRFCQEIHKCSSKLAGSNVVDSPVLWSSSLYQQERELFHTPRAKSFASKGAHTAGHGACTNSSTHSIYANVTAPSLSPNPRALRGLAIHAPKSLNGFWQAAKPNPYLKESTQHLKQSQTNPIVNPTAMPAPRTGTSAQHSDFLPSHGALSGQPTKEVSKAHQAFTAHIQRIVTAFLLSDLGYILWGHGSETDAWIHTQGWGKDTETLPPPFPYPKTSIEPLSEASASAVSDALSDSTITINQPDKPADHASGVSTHIHGLLDAKPSLEETTGQLARTNKSTAQEQDPFPFSDAFETVLRRFSLSADPLVKLDMLAELESLVICSIDSANRSRELNYGHNASMPDFYQMESMPRPRNLNIPRTKATSLEEVMANCTERRAGTMRYTATATASRTPLGNIFDPPGTDTIVDAILNIFRNDNLRPRTLYRDLQFIATFIPSEILDQSPKGKAFWDVGLAALAYKEERCEAMIHRANQITNYHVSAKKDTSSFMNAYSPDLVDTSLADAAQLWVTIAKEGSPAACRELGLFYLTHPELLPRVTLPFSKSKDVFKSVSSSDRTSIETGGLDPLTFAVVFHWMELAANGGDQDARNFIRGNGELGAAR